MDLFYFGENKHNQLFVPDEDKCALYNLVLIGLIDLIIKIINQLNNNTPHFSIGEHLSGTVCQTFHIIT